MSQQQVRIVAIVVVCALALGVLAGIVAPLLAG